VFHRGAVQALLPEEAQLAAPLTALVRRELLRPDRSQFAGEDAFRFRHLLIRDAAYDALPKAIRARLHERFATWLVERGADLIELDEVVGYHLERAYRYRLELGPADEAALNLSHDAAERLAAAGTKAVSRGDMRAATTLLERAVALYPAHDLRRLSLLPSLGRALQEVGQWDRADAVLSEAVQVGLATGERRMAADAAVALTHLRLYADSTNSHEKARNELAEAVVVFEEFGDEAGLARAVGLAGQLRFWAGNAASAIDDLERAAHHAHSAGDRPQEIQSLGYVLLATVNGPTPVASALERVEQMRGQVEGDRRLEVTIMRCQARLEAMRGDFELARELIAAAMAQAEELGLEVSANGVRFEAAEVELLAGRIAIAEHALRPAVEALQRMGNHGHFVTVAPVLADLLLAQGRGDEAAPIIELVMEWAMEDDLDAQIGWRRSRAKLLAQRGEFESAEQLAREAVEVSGRTDFLDVHARAIEDLAEVLRLAGRPHESVPELEHAIRLHQQKGNIVSTARAQRLLESLIGPTTAA
jgi:tetratricopeptide (TPR) repeat protein